jgi:hypothetical protein|tara:strand:- start:252 stop:374 length:123 start_codon:yes stop_codon:yes gene_type:complete
VEIGEKIVVQREEYYKKHPQKSKICYNLKITLDIIEENVI